MRLLLQKELDYVSEVICDNQPLPYPSYRGYQYTYAIQEMSGSHRCYDYLSCCHRLINVYFLILTSTPFFPFLQTAPLGSESKLSTHQYCLFLRRWHPSTLQFGVYETITTEHIDDTFADLKRRVRYCVPRILMLCTPVRI